MNNDGTISEILSFSSPSYKEALIGISHDNRAIYDYEKMIECLMKENNLSYEDAVDFISYNTIRSLPYYPNGPIVMFPKELTELE